MSAPLGPPAGSEARRLQALPIAYATKAMRVVLVAWAIATIAGFSAFAVFAERGDAGTTLGLLMTAMSLVSAVVVNASFDAIGVPALRRRFGVVMAIWLPWFTACLAGLVFLNSAFAGAPVLLGLLAALPLVAALARRWSQPPPSSRNVGCGADEDRVLVILRGVEHLDEALTARLLGMGPDDLRAVIRPLQEQGVVRVDAGGLRRRRLSLVDATEGSSAR